MPNKDALKGLQDRLHAAGELEDPDVKAKLEREAPVVEAAEAKPAVKTETAPAAGGDSFRRDIDGRILLRYKGRELAMTPEEVTNLAQKGFAADRSMQEAARMREELQTESEGWRRYQSYQNFLRQNPDLAENIGNQIMRREQGLPLEDIPAGDLDEIDAGVEGGMQRPIQTAVPVELQQFMQEARGRFEQEDRKTAAENIANQVMSALDQYPALRLAGEALERRGMSNVVLERLTKALHDDPGGDHDAISRSLATEYQALLGDSVGIPNEEGGDEDRDFRSESPSAAPVGPASSASNSFGAGDLKSGAIAKGAAEFLRQSLTR